MFLEELAIKYGTDKRINGGHGYTKFYSARFEPIRFCKLNILELGVREGWSLRMWNEYFPNSMIWGIDNDMEKLCPKSFEEERIKFRIGSQDDAEFLNGIVKEVGGFDAIFDDASHVSPLSIKSFEILFPTLNPRGLYVIEDLHVCDYDSYYLPHGPSTIQYINNIDKKQFNIRDINLINNKICFIRKE